MTNLVQRLRDQGKDAFAKQYSLGMFKLCDEAAERIEELERLLREARRCCDPAGDPTRLTHATMTAHIDAALRKGE